MIIDQFDVFLFDLDGVLYIGDEACPYAGETIERLKEAGKHVRFVTNNPCTTRKRTAEKLNRLGIGAAVEEIVTSGSATGNYLVEREMSRVHLLGDELLQEEFELFGIENVELARAEAVVVGWDDDITFGDIREAAKAIRNGMPFIATESDLVFPMPGGPAPATGTIVVALEAASGVKATVIGKPYEAMFQAATKDFAKSVRAIMIGDNVETDIKGAHNFGIPAVLIAHEFSNSFKQNDMIQPEVEISHLKQLFDINIETKEFDLSIGNVSSDIKVAVAAMIQDENGQVLLINRKDSGEWGIPSGHVEPGETVEAAVIREIREETNLVVEVERLIGVYSDPKSQIFTYPNGEMSQFVTIYFSCKVVGGELIKVTDETTDAKYFTANELPKNLMKMHPTWLTDALEQGSVFIR